MHPYRKTIVAISLALLVPLAASAQSLSDLKEMSHDDRRAAYERMSEEERSAIRDQRRSEYDSMSEEEREAMRKKRAGQRDERWESMSEEERNAAREKRHSRWESMSEEERAVARERRGDYEGHRKGHGKHDHANKGGKTGDNGNRQ